MGGGERMNEGRNGGKEEKEESGTVGLISFSQVREWKHTRDYFSAYISHLTLKG